MPNRTQVAIPDWNSISEKGVYKDMHFTVLTDVFLPEDYGGAGQLTVQAPLNDLVAAVRYADSPERESLTEYDCNLLYNQMCLEQTVYGLVGDRLYPYWMNADDPEYMKFYDFTEQCKLHYETDSAVQVRMVDGRWVLAEDCYAFDRYEVFEGKVYRYSYGRLHHRKRTKKAKRMLVREVPFCKLYKDFGEYAEKYCGYDKKEGTDAYGYYFNPNTHWEWFQVGGRWLNRFLVKSDCHTVVAGDPSILLKHRMETNAPEGYYWVTGARKKDIAWDVMKSMAIQSEQEIFLSMHNVLVAGTGLMRVRKNYSNRHLPQHQDHRQPRTQQQKLLRHKLDLQVPLAVFMAVEMASLVRVTGRYFDGIILLSTPVFKSGQQ